MCVCVCVIDGVCVCVCQLDSHDVGRDRDGVVAALSSIAQPMLVMGIDSDALYPL